MAGPDRCNHFSSTGPNQKKWFARRCPKAKLPLKRHEAANIAKIGMMKAALSGLKPAPEAAPALTGKRTAAES